MLGIRRHNRERTLAAALEASLDALHSGTATVEDCLQRYPALAADLEPLLVSGARLQEMQRLKPSEAARLDARFALMQAAAARRPITIAPRTAVRRRSWLALAPAAVAAALFAAIAIPILGSIDNNAVPGDWNYSFKRATERVRLALATDPTDRRLLRIEFARRRLNEIERLSGHGQVESHAGEVAALIKDFTSDVSQVTSAAQSQGKLANSAEQQQLESVASQAQVVLQPIAANAPQDKPVKSVAEQAVSVSKEAARTAASLPTASRPASPPAPSVAANRPASSATSAPESGPHAATTPAGSPAAAATSTPEPAASPTPPLTSAVSAPATSTPASTTLPATPAPTAVATSAPSVPTRTALVLTPVSNPPQTSGAAAAAPAQTESPTERPAPPPTRTATVTPSRTAALETTAAATPARTPVRAAPTPAATAAATRAVPIEAGLLVTGLDADYIYYRWAGPTTALDLIMAPLGHRVVVVYYAGQNQPTGTWYPGTPAPLIGPNVQLTVKLRAPETPPAAR